MSSEVFEFEDGTLVLNFAGGDCGDSTFECPDCEGVVELHNGEGVCECRDWSMAVAVRGKEREQSSTANEAKG